MSPKAVAMWCLSPGRWPGGILFVLNHFIGRARGRTQGQICQYWTLLKSPHIRSERLLVGFCFVFVFSLQTSFYFIMVQMCQMEYVEFHFEAGEIASLNHINSPVNKLPYHCY